MATMNLESAAVLGRLFQAEFRCPTARLDQSMPYVRMAETGEHATLEKIASEDREHLEWLTDLIFSRGGSPPPASFATDSAASHYLQLDRMLPGLIHSERELLAQYQSISAGLADDPEAAQVVARIVGRHTTHLGALEALRQRRLAAKAQ